MAQKLLSAARELEQDFTAVGLAARASDETVRLQPVAQLDSAVMLDLQSLGQYTDRHLGLTWQSLDRQQRLMLLRLDASDAHGLLAKIQEPANFVPKISQRSIINSACHCSLQLSMIVS